MTTLVPVRRRETRDLWDVAGELDRIFDSPVDLVPAMSVREGLWHPTMDVYNLPQEIVVCLELPGVKMEDLELTIEENHLIVEGSRRRIEEYKEEDLFHTERSFGGFHRIVHLPSDVDADTTEARFTDGLLTIKMPKVKRLAGKKIDIKT